MPKLSFNDVFLDDKADVVAKIKEMEKTLQMLTTFLTDRLLDEGVREVTIHKDEFLEKMARAGIEQPVGMHFHSTPDMVHISIESA